ncbi:hypothetical protein [Delftia phage PhiW-14]|uniref:Uncharacterized protein n=1 Tax=Delftia phage PhiW-14 TaxID=665032 RepID=C9DG84_BPW14|nr:hypothetical protein DP-phiW-14_gp114 [Delftia phage PhiW-14]ACV50135.1 hypothetical protein [Delftia phage PhiW-14]
MKNLYLLLAAVSFVAFCYPLMVGISWTFEEGEGEETPWHRRWYVMWPCAALCVALTIKCLGASSDIEHYYPQPTQEADPS